MPMILTAIAMLILVADPALADTTPPIVPYNNGYHGGDYANKGYGGGDYYSKGYGSSYNAQPSGSQSGYDKQPPTSGMFGSSRPACLAPSHPSRLGSIKLAGLNQELAARHQRPRPAVALGNRLIAGTVFEAVE